MTGRTAMTHAISIHPLVDRGVKPGAKEFAGGTLVCRCPTEAVKVKITGQIAHNHACGCTKCWKPQGAAFSVVAVTPRENLTVVENGATSFALWIRAPRFSATPARNAACICTAASRT